MLNESKKCNNRKRSGAKNFQHPAEMQNGFMVGYTANFRLELHLLRMSLWRTNRTTENVVITLLTFCYHLLCNFLNNTVSHYENFKFAIYT